MSNSAVSDLDPRLGRYRGICPPGERMKAISIGVFSTALDRPGSCSIDAVARLRISGRR